MNAITDPNFEEWPQLPPLPIRLRDTFASPSALIGLPYVRGGVSPDVGFDCYTLLAYVRWHWFARHTPMVALPRRKLSPAATCAVCIRRALGERDGVGTPWQRCEPQEGCAVALGVTSFGRLHHCGVWINGGVLHALEGVGVCWTPGERLPALFRRVECYECD